MIRALDRHPIRLTVYHQSSHARLHNIVVIGGGIAGLLAARAFQRHGIAVTIIDARNTKESATEFSFSAKPTVVSAGAYQLICAWFPGIDQTLRKHAAPEVDWCRDLICDTPYGKAPRLTSNARSRGCSEHLLASAMRHALLSDGGVTLIESAKVESIHRETHSSGVFCIRYRHDQRTHQSIAVADNYARSEYVVVATGAPSTLLQNKGFYPRVPHLAQSGNLAYQSCVYEQASLGLPQCKAMHAFRPKETPHAACSVYPIEDGAAVVSVVSWGDNAFDKVDETTLLELIRERFRTTSFGGLSKGFALSPVSTGLAPFSRMYRFDTASLNPEGLIYVGDAVLQGNPLMAKGFFGAAVGATTLSHLLNKTQQGSAREIDVEAFHTAQHRTLSRVWKRIIGETDIICGSGVEHETYTEYAAAVLRRLLMRRTIASNRLYRNYVERFHCIVS